MKNRGWVKQRKRRKKFSTFASPMSTRCQYVEGERKKKKGNLFTHADQYHSLVVVVVAFSIFDIFIYTHIDYYYYYYDRKN